MDALVPRRTDILLWEYVINDWLPQQQNPKYLSNALDLYLRRALAINPRMVFVFVYLWAPAAAFCWPFCERQKFIWNATDKPLAQYDTMLDRTEIDFNDIAAQYYLATVNQLRLQSTQANESTKAMFFDKQHPKHYTHEIIGQIVWLHFWELLRKSARTEGHEGAKVETDSLPMPASMPAATSSSDASPAAQLMGRLLSSPQDVHSWTHSVPHLGDATQYITYGLGDTDPSHGHVLDTAIAAAQSRSDSVIYAYIPVCDENRTRQLRHTLLLPKAPSGPPRFIGLNVVGPMGGAVGPARVAPVLDSGKLLISASFACRHENATGSYAHRTVLRTQHLVPGSLLLSDLVTESNVTILSPGISGSLRFPDDHGTGLAVLLRGIHAPQLWFRLPPPACGAEKRVAELSVWACNAADFPPPAWRVNGVGAVVFV